MRRRWETGKTSLENFFLGYLQAIVEMSRRMQKLVLLNKNFIFGGAKELQNQKKISVNFVQQQSNYLVLNRKRLAEWRNSFLICWFYLLLFNYFSIFGAMCPFWQTFMLHIFCKENEHKQKEFHIGFCF